MNKSTLYFYLHFLAIISLTPPSAAHYVTADECQNKSLFADGLVSYSMRQGETRGNEVDLHDMTYDGEVNNKQLSGGLGQLTDGQEGQWNFR